MQNRNMLAIKSFIIIAVLTYAFLLLFVKYTEKTSLFLPSPEITATPADVGLDYQDLYITTKDGVKLNAWFIETKEDAPTILYFHGNAGNLSLRVDIIKVFADMGCNVFIPDYRGYGKSQGSPSEKGLYTDAMSCYKFLVEEKNIPPSRIVIYGKSLGSGVASNLAYHVEAGALVIDSGMPSGVEMAKNMFPYAPRFLLKHLLSVEFDSVSKIKNLKTPKLIIHSRDDEITPFRFGRQIFEEASEPKEFYETMGYHNDAFFQTKGYMETLRNFMEKYLSQG